MIRSFGSHPKLYAFSISILYSKQGIVNEIGTLTFLWICLIGCTTRPILKESNFSPKSSRDLDLTGMRSGRLTSNQAFVVELMVIFYSCWMIVFENSTYITPSSLKSARHLNSILSSTQKLTFAFSQIYFSKAELSSSFGRAFLSSIFLAPYEMTSLSSQCSCPSATPSLRVKSTRSTLSSYSVRHYSIK